MMAPTATTVVRRIAVAVAVVMTASALLIGARHTPDPSSVQPQLGGEPHHTWLDLRTTTREELLAVVDTLCTPMLNDGSDTHGAAPTFIAPQDLYDCARAVLVSVLSGDPAPYLTEMLARGSTIDRAMCLAIAEEWADWRLIAAFDAARLDTTDLFRALWAEQSARAMNILELRPDWTQVGVGMSVDYARDSWPYEGVRACMSTLIPPGGRLAGSAGQRLDGTPASAHITVLVVYGDEKKGLLRINFFYESATRRWYPITLAVGSDALDQWPFPFF